MTARPDSPPDRQSYSVSGVTANQTGTMADVLDRIPSVDVDAEGNVTLRGQSNVVILVDGKPLSGMQGAERGVALTSMSIEDVERIEVLTNPPASFASDGASGVINIVRKRARRARVATTLLAALGTEDRMKFSATASRIAGPLSMRGSASYRQDVGGRSSEIEREEINAGGTATFYGQSSDFRFIQKRWDVAAELSYAPSSNESLTVDGSYWGRRGTYQIRSELDARAANGTVTLDADRNSERSFDRRYDGAASVKYSRKSAGGQTLDIGIGYSQSDFDGFDFNLYQFRVPMRADYIEYLIERRNPRVFTANADYKAGLLSGTVSAGLYLERWNHDYDNSFARIDPATGNVDVDPGFSAPYSYDRNILAGYASWQREFGNTRVIAGLRIESARQSINNAEWRRQGEVAYNPNLNISRTLGSGWKLIGSYSKRVQRPEPADLNPTQRFGSIYAVFAGNPDLLPERSDSVELSVEKTSGPSNFAARLFYRAIDDVILDQSRFLASGTLLSTRINGGESVSYGVSLSGKWQVQPSLSLTGSMDAARTLVISDGVAGTFGDREVLAVSGKLAISADLSPRHRVQGNLGVSPRILTGQGYRAAAVTNAFGYRFQANSRLSVIATVTDPFDIQRVRSVIETPLVREVNRGRLRVRAAHVAINLSLGSGRKGSDDILTTLDP